jgi:ribosome-associated protein
MARKSRRGQYVDGERVAAVDDSDHPPGIEPPDTQGPSRTARKNESEQLQRIGERLITLRADVIAGLSLPERLQDAIVQAKRLTNFGAKRRQMQFIGKLMRQLDSEALDAVEAALRVGQGRSAQNTSIRQRAQKRRKRRLQ